eukprot:2158800-Rhodomonas_salina.2
MGYLTQEKQKPQRASTGGPKLSCLERLRAELEHSGAVWFGQYPQNKLEDTAKHRDQMLTATDSQEQARAAWKELMDEQGPSLVGHYAGAEVIFATQVLRAEIGHWLVQAMQKETVEYNSELDAVARATLEKLATVNMMWGPCEATVAGTAHPGGSEQVEAWGAASVRKEMELGMKRKVMPHTARRLWTLMQEIHAQTGGHHLIYEQAYVVLRSRDELWQLKGMVRRLNQAGEAKQSGVGSAAETRKDGA